MSDQSAHDPQTSYDAVADDYTSRIAAELQHKPFDRLLLDQFAEQVRDLGWVADIGCGPGHVARYLHDRGVPVVGIDLSARMIDSARKLHPTIEFQQADMEALPVPNEAWEGITAFYSLIHIPRDRVVATLREFRRVLRPRGLLLLAFHIGAEVVHLDEWWGHRVSVDFVLFRSDEVESYPSADTPKPASRGRPKTGQSRAPQDDGSLPSFLSVLQVRLLARAPAPRSALEYVTVVKEAIEHRGHGGCVAE